jgi:hypothetical protein
MTNSIVEKKRTFRLNAKGSRNMGFACSGPADKHNILRRIHELAPLLHLSRW